MAAALLGLLGLAGLAGTQHFGAFQGHASLGLKTASKVMIYKDVLTGDEMITDNYELTEAFNGAALTAKSSLEDGNEGEKVLNIPKHFHLQEMELPKKDFMLWAKDYMKKLLPKLQKDDPDRVADFKRGATDMIKFVMSKYDEFQLFAGSGPDPLEGGPAMAYTKEGDLTPTFYFFKDGLKGVKY